MERRLTAILAADVVGYSRLMGANEVATLQALQQHQAELVEPETSRHGGRIVKLTGDGALVEFPSVIGAVECATAIQRAMPDRNADVPEDRRIEYRIGINLDDVIVEGDDLFGDGVNIAARLEGIARPGGIAISQSVYDKLGNRLDLAIEDRGEQQLKNIARPVRVFDVLIGSPRPSAASGTTRAAPHKPSIAVLPFTNMSGDAEQEYFSDGITEDIITDLSKISSLFVVGRHSSFAYKEKLANLILVATELGVRYLLEGSVRKAGNRVRITAQLIDGTTGGHLWADRYDRDLIDIFAIQDEITKAIVEQLRVRLLREEEQAIGTGQTANIEAYKYYLQGRQFFHYLTKNYLLMARRMFATAVELDPDYARAYAGIANCDARLNERYGAGIATDQILAITDKAIALQPDLAESHAARGVALADSGRRGEAAEAFGRALALDPNSYEANSFYARFCVVAGDYERAAELYIRALEIQPDDFQAPAMAEMALRALGRTESSVEYARLALRRAEEALRQHPENSRPAQLGAGLLATLGEMERAKEWLARALAIEPDDNNARYNAACTYIKLGEFDRAFELLEDWARHAGEGTKRWALKDADLHPLRGHPRFAKLLKAIGDQMTA